MKPKLNKNFSFPWTPHGEKASENHQILLPRGKATVVSRPDGSDLTTRTEPVHINPTVLMADNVLVTNLLRACANGNTLQSLPCLK